MKVPVADLLATGRAALRAGDAQTARDALEQAFGLSPSADVVECLARVAYLELDYAAAIDTWERAYAAHRTAGDQVGAVRVARSLGYAHGSINGNWAVCQGWMSRAQRLLEGVGDTPERGWVALNLGMFEGDRTRKEAHYQRALEVARQTGDTDLEFVALAYQGASFVHGDRTEAGMALLDESLAAVAGHDVDDFVALEEIFCQLFSACEYANDIDRADQWIRVGEKIAQRRKLPVVAAFCRTHYGGVLTAAGRWPEADATLTEAVRLWGVGRRSVLRIGALVRLADLRVRQGRFEEAEQLLDDVDTDHVDAARALAVIHVARGDTGRAVEILEHALGGVPPASATAVRLLEVLVEVHLAAGAPAAANVAADRLERCTDERPGDQFVAAATSFVRGRVARATGSDGAADHLRRAATGFTRAQLPVEAARSRLELALAVLGSQPDLAAVEARAALDEFDRLQADRDSDAAAAVLRSLGIRSAAKRTDGVLTRREVEVLDLLGLGLSNPEIAARLFISRKTAEHHVGNILAKLGLRSRAEAVGYVLRNKPATG